MAPLSCWESGLQLKVHRQIKCAEEDWRLNREWTRIAVMTLCGFVSNNFSNGVGSEFMALEQLIFRLFLLYTRSFAVQNCFPSMLPKLSMSRSVLSSSSPNYSLDSVLRASFVVEPESLRKVRFFK